MIDATLCCVTLYSLRVWFWKDLLCFVLNFALALWSYYFFPFWSQYGPIAHIDLKIPPRPPGYAFVEVSLKMLTFHSFSFFFFLEENQRSILMSQSSIVVWRGSWRWGCNSWSWWLWFWWASVTGIYCLMLVYVACVKWMLCISFSVVCNSQVELAHGGRGRSSSDRHSSYNSGRGRGVSRRSEYRGV